MAFLCWTREKPKVDVTPNQATTNRLITKADKTENGFHINLVLKKQPSAKAANVWY